MNTTNLIANEKPKCSEVLEACNLYVGDLEAFNKKLYRKLKDKNERISELEKGHLGIAWYWYLIGGVAAGYAASKL